jgi:C-terminal processing protease CtpA/Prc
MVLHSSTTAYPQPIYILVNEETFSAASVFASSFKDLPNVKIVGGLTDGSSGNSKTLYLKNSHIRINVSTMLSFQRNGKTLDGNGTVPDILIQADEQQVMKGSDSQLNKLIEMINNTH